MNRLLIRLFASFSIFSEVFCSSVDPLVNHVLPIISSHLVGHTRYASEPASLREAAKSVIAYHILRPSWLSRDVAIDLSIGSFQARVRAVSKIERSLPDLDSVISPFIEVFYNEAASLCDLLALELALHQSLCRPTASVDWNAFVDRLEADVMSITEAIVDSDNMRDLGSEARTSSSRRRVPESDPPEYIIWEVVGPLVHACELSKRVGKSLPGLGVTGDWKFLRNFTKYMTQMEVLVCELAHFEALKLQPDTTGLYRSYSVDYRIARKAARECPDPEEKI